MLMLMHEEKYIAPTMIQIVDAGHIASQVFGVPQGILTTMPSKLFEL